MDLEVLIVDLKGIRSDRGFKSTTCLRTCTLVSIFGASVGRSRRPARYTLQWAHGNLSSAAWCGILRNLVGE